MRLKRKRIYRTPEMTVTLERTPSRASMHTAGQARWELIKRWVIGCAAAILTTALQTTLFAGISLPWLSPASPSLALLFVLSAGFFLGEREGAVAGLLAGFFAEAAAGGGGIMLLPLLYTLCGFFVGVLSRDHLGHNLPSYLVWAAVAGIWEQAFRYARAAVSVRGFPPAVMLTQDLFPHLLLTLCFAPAVYGGAKLLCRVFNGVRT